MKSKVLARVMGNEFAKRVISVVTKFYVENEGLILTSGAIGFELIATGLALKNASQIEYIIQDAKEALWQCNTKEERCDVYKLTLKELTPLVTSIFIFQAASIACILLNKRRTDKVEAKLVETAGALAIAQTAISQYQSFQKEAEEALGEEKIHEIQKEIDAKTVYQASGSPINSKQSDDDQLIYEPTTGQLIWSTPDRINLAWVMYREEVRNSDDRFVPIGNVFFEKMGADYRTAAAEVFGYYNEDAVKMPDEVYLDSTKVIVNGKEMAVLKMNYYPAIRLATDEVFE